MIRRAFRSAFGDDEIEDIYSNAWLGTLRALERRHDRLSDEEIRKYVLTAVANHASKEFRRRKRRPTAPLEASTRSLTTAFPPTSVQRSWRSLGSRAISWRPCLLGDAR